MYSAVIFDLDGTLLNTLDDLAAAGNHALHLHGLPPYAADAYRTMVGNGIPKLVQRMLAPHGREDLQGRMLEDFTLYYNAHMQDHTAPYPGMVPLLRRMAGAGIACAILSNKAHPNTAALAQHYFGGLVGAAAGKKPDVPPKPNPAAVYTLMEELGADKNTTLYVGDSDVDMQTAKNAGLPACGVLWGFRCREELAAAGADFLVEDAAGLQALIFG